MNRRLAAAFFASATVVICLALTPPAQADPPAHGRATALDIEGLNHACGVAVDNKGDVYASSAGESKVKVYNPAHVELTSIANANEPCGLAVNTKGELFVSEKATGKVVRYKPNAYPFAGTPTYGSAEPIDSSGNAKGIAVDRADDRLYVAEGNHIAIYKADGSFEANVGTGNLTEATGVSAYTYINTGATPTNLKRHYYLTVADDAADQVKIFAAKEGSTLKLRRTIDGVDHDEDPETADQEFGFGAAGAHLAADPGNESRETRKCAQVQVEGNNQACTGGHFFLYDAANEAVDEFDATGEFVDQITNGAFADAGPTALAVDRSGTASDGTLYVSAGASAGAKLLAFTPLGMPARDPAPALSHALTAAVGVATDCKGNVYVAAEALIHVYAPTGVKLTSFTDAEGPEDVATDCEGNVYVVDTDPEEPVLTYYSPSKFPPDNTTTYTRHEPELIPGPFGGTGLKAVAVNPANDHVFVVGNSAFTPIVAEFSSVAEDSELIRECGTGFSLASARTDIDVYGATGEVYVATNPQGIATLKCEEPAELLVRQIKGGGCPGGELGFNPMLAVDQSNGHIVEYARNQTGASAREYDSSGACVAEFGTFANSSPLYKVAVDSSCALHDPPLTAQTTPTCAATYPSNGTAYVAVDGLDNGVQPNDVTAFGPLEYPPPPGKPAEASTGKADGFGPDKATLRGEVTPNSSLLVECRFEYLTEAEYQGNGKDFTGAEVVPCAESFEEIGNGAKPVPVHADVEGLEVETPYRFRLFAANKFPDPLGLGTGEAEAFTLSPPQIEAKSALPVGYDEATLRGEVNSFGADTEYRFEYLTQAEYEENGGTWVGAQSTPVAVLPAGEGFVAVGAPVTGLAEGTVYRFRLLAENGVGPASEGPTAEGPVFETLERTLQDCENAEYRTGFSAFLPDCRAYELASLPQMFSSPGSFTSTAGHRFFNSWFVDPRGPGAGESITYLSDVARADGRIFRAQRGEGDHPEEGWGSEMYGFNFVQGAGDEGSPGGISADQLYMVRRHLADEIPTEQAFPVGNYIRVPSGKASRECAPEPKAQFELSDPESRFELVGCGDLGTDLKAEARFVSAGGTHVIFTSDEQLDDEAPSSGVEAIYDRKAGETGTKVVSVKSDGSPFGAGEEPRYIAATEDGTAIVFSVNGTLYVHREGSTTQVADAPNTYAGISEDGKRVFFMDEIGSDPVPPAGLFACDIEAVPCVGGVEPPGLTQIAEDSVFVNVSADGSHAFFTSEEALTGSEENENSEEAEAGESNLYAWDGTNVSFVAILHPQDLVSFQKGAGKEEIREDLLQWVNVIPGQYATTGATYESGRAYSPTRSTPDGEVLVFQSHAQLTPYDNDEKGEIYRYDLAAPVGSQLSCVSCDPSGAPHDFPADALFDSAFGVVEPSTMIPNLTDDGQKVFFESREALLPEDANEVTDVYEWKAPGVAGPGGDVCERLRGCLALISTGQGEEASFLFGMSANGSDVFFVTREVLAGGDVSGSSSIYDARILGGIPNPPPKEACQGDACQGQGSTPPALPAPATTGAGGGDENPTPAKKCAKGKHRAKGRCVPNRHRKHGRKGSKHGKHRAGHEGRANR